MVEVMNPAARRAAGLHKARRQKVRPSSGRPCDGFSPHALRDPGPSRYEFLPDGWSAPYALALSWDMPFGWLRRPRV